MIFESHAHYDDPRYDEDRDLVLSSLNKNNVKKVINVAADMQSSFDSIALAEKYDFIFASIGVHPHEASSMTNKDLETLIRLSTNKKVVAIGEIGLDYYYENSPKEEQKLWFRKQINIAKQVNLPIIVHSREATKDTFEILMESKYHEVGGVIHCFSGSKEVARQYAELGYYIGVGGVITYKNAKKLVEVVQEIPLKHILIETDAPYLSPTPQRGKRNDSTNLKYVIETIAKLKNVSEDEVMRITYENGLRLFRINE